MGDALNHLRNNFGKPVTIGKRVVQRHRRYADNVGVAPVGYDTIGG
jgi:hypothetical protein